MQQGRRNREVRKSPRAYQNVTHTCTFYTEGLLSRKERSRGLAQKNFISAPLNTIGREQEWQHSSNKKVTIGHFTFSLQDCHSIESRVILSLFTILLLHFFMSNVQCAPRHKINTYYVLYNAQYRPRPTQTYFYDVFCT